MDESFEEQYQGVLQNMEFALAQVYRADPKMTDYAAFYAVESLIKLYNAEQQGRTIATPQFQPHEQEAFDSLKAICEWRLGRQALVSENDEEVNLGQDANTPEEIIACLKRIKKSIEFWQKRGGRRSYFEFVSRFLP
ncbi:MAG TPA: hypothetical protein VEF04_12670 [Blastocatellia bacterium]|nr:hypothetical protein [Blastocatellia bacterium]